MVEKKRLTLPSIEANIKIFKKIIIILICLTIFIKIILFILNIPTGKFITLNNSIDYITLLFTIFLLVISISQFIYSISVSEFSSHIIIDFKKDIRFIRFFVFEITFIIFYLIMNTCYLSSLISNLTIITLLITMYLLLDIIDLQLTFSEPQKYLTKIKEDILIKQEYEKIGIISDICKKYISKQEIFLSKKSIKYLIDIIKENNKNYNKQNRKNIENVLNELYYIYDYSLRMNTEEIAIMISKKLYEIYLEDMQFNEYQIQNEFTQTNFIKVFIINDTLIPNGNYKETKNFYSFYNKSIEYESESTDYLNFILIHNIGIIYNVNYNKKINPNYIWLFMKKVIDKNKFNEYKKIFYEIPKLQVERYDLNSKINKLELNIYLINMNFLAIGGYILYKFKDDNLIKYMNELYNHNITKYRVNYFNYQPNIFYKSLGDLIELYLNFSYTNFSFEYNLDLENKYYINQFFSYILMDSNGSVTKNIDRLKNFLYYKEEIINSFETKTYNKFLENDIFTKKANLKDIFEKIEKLLQNEINNYEFDKGDLEEIEMEFKNKFQKNLIEFDEEFITQKDKKYDDIITKEIIFSKERFIEFKNNPMYIHNTFMIRDDDLIKIIIEDYIRKNPYLIKNNIEKDNLHENHKKILISYITSENYETKYQISNIKMEFDCQVKCNEDNDEMIVQLTIKYNILDDLKIYKIA